MPRFINDLVFQPPRDDTSLAYVRLCQVRQYMKYVTMKGGEQLYYLHIIAPRRRPCPFFSSSPWKNSLTLRRSQKQLVVLYNHGNAEDLGGCFSVVRWLRDSLGVDVVAYDYRGYGYSKDASSKKPFETVEKSVYEDADQMYTVLLDLGYGPSQIIVMGRSLGGGPASYLAEKHHKEIAGLILESTFTSCMHVVSTCCIPTFFPYWNMFENKKRMKKITSCPILFMHGDCDDVVPFRCSLSMLDTATRTRNKLKTEVDKALKKLTVTGNPSTGSHHSPMEEEAPRQDSLHSVAHLSCSSAVWPATIDQNSNSVDAVVPNPRTPQDLNQSVGQATSASPPCGRLPGSPPSTICSSQTETNLGEVSALHLAALEKKHIRSYRQAADIVETAQEKLGIFFHWFAGRSHNDIENLDEGLFLNVMDRFLEFAARTAPPVVTTLTSAHQQNA